jgi:regulator of RNase E activity RraA
LPVSRPAADGRLCQDRHDPRPRRGGRPYLDYVAAAPRPSVIVIEDKDEPAGYGAFWGEVQTNIHKSLGCLGVVTSGSIRDIPASPRAFQMLAGSIAPSHAYVHVVDIGLSVTIHSMEVKSGDLIHADRHGAVVVPVEKIDAMAAALDGLMKHEAKIIADDDIKHISAGFESVAARDRRIHSGAGGTFAIMHVATLADTRVQFFTAHSGEFETRTEYGFG